MKNGASADSEWNNKINEIRMPSRAVERAGKEIKADEPEVVAKTRKKKGKAAAQKQRVAIMLSKARRGA